MTGTNRISSPAACGDVNHFAGPLGARTFSHHDRAAEVSDNLSQAGFDVVIKTPNRDCIKLALMACGVGIGNVNIWPKGNVSFNEIKVAAYAPAVKAACSGNVPGARELASAAVTALIPDEDGVNIYIASSGSSSFSAYGGVVADGGIFGRPEAGDVPGPAALAEVSGAIQMLTRVIRFGADKVVVYAPAHVGKYATGEMTAREPQLSAFVNKLISVADDAPTINWAARDIYSEGHRIAKRAAETRFDQID